VLALHAAHYRDANGIERLTDVSLEVRAGEVLGVLGVEGAGQRELLRLLAGRLEPTRGKVTRPARVGFIPEDRLHDALIPSFTLTENLALAGAGQRRGLLDWAGFQRSTAEAIAAMDVRAAGETAPAWTLSGGNQQRFVVARERAAAAHALVVENPTRGLDLRATARVREEIAARAGDPPAAVVYYSSDIDEVLAVATRIVVCFAGRVHEVSPAADPADTTPFTRALMGAF
jgi:simple sugar transport system ATP-binding protein